MDQLTKIRTAIAERVLPVILVDWVEQLSKGLKSYINLNHTALAHDTTMQLEDIHCPTLIMADRLDPVCGMVGTDLMIESIPNSETIIFERSSHFFMIEEAEKAMSKLTDWFTKHTP